MWRPRHNPFEEPAPLIIDNQNWTRLQHDPQEVIPYRVMLAAGIISFVVIAGGFWMNLPILRMLVGYWIGVLANLISFRSIIIGAEKYLEKSKMGLKPSTAGGFLLRQGIAAVAIFFAISLGGFSLLMVFLGLSMIKIIVQLDGFFSFKGR